MTFETDGNDKTLTGLFCQTSGTFRANLVPKDAALLNLSSLLSYCGIFTFHRTNNPIWETGMFPFGYYMSVPLEIRL